MNEQHAGATPSEQPTPETATPDQPAWKPSYDQIAAIIAERLGESHVGVRIRFRQIVKALGQTQSLALLEETLQIEEQGGMLVPDGSRRRTPGGVFFSLVYTKGQPRPGRTLPFRRPRGAAQAATSAQTETTQSAPPAQVPIKPTAPVPPATPFTWAERERVLETIGEQTGRTTTVKITVIGTMGTYIERGNDTLPITLPFGS